MSMMDNIDAFPDLEQNYRRGLGLLRLAAEQTRIFDPKTAAFVCSDHLEPLSFWFDNVVKSPRYQKFLEHDSGHYEKRRMRQLASDAWELGVRPQMPPTPPGLGFQALGFQEATSHGAFDSASLFRDSSSDDEITPTAGYNNSPNHSSPWTLQSSKSHTANSQTAVGSPSTSYIELEGLGRTFSKGDFGAIGSKSKNSTTHGVDGIKRPTPWSPMAEPSVQASVNTATNGLHHLPQPLPNGTRGEHPAAPAVGPGAVDHDSTRLAREFERMVEKYVLAHKEELLGSLVATQGQHTSSYGSSSSGVQSPSVGLHNVSTSSTATLEGEIEVQKTAPTTALEPSSWAKIAAIPAESGESAAAIKIALSEGVNGFAHQRRDSKPVEPRSEQHRVVWLANLPSGFTLRDVSLQISQGPVMSILLQQDVHESLPGKSACIIFMQAEQAAMYLDDNGWDFAKQRFAGPTTYATGPVVPWARRQPGVANIRLLPGSPYALDEPLRSMNPPNHARRRLKWSRARIFYDVSKEQFKRDVLSTVGGPTNVELFHFYNAGECTVVFASVGVAAACLAAFQEWRMEKLEGASRWLKEDDARLGKKEGHLDRKKGKYEGVEVGFVKDFNEAPAKLYSHYDRHGRISDRVEGLFEGPAVAWP